MMLEPRTREGGTVAGMFELHVADELMQPICRRRGLVAVGRARPLYHMRRCTQCARYSRARPGTVTLAFVGAS